jgi:hypothetical protein
MIYYDDGVFIEGIFDNKKVKAKRISAWVNNFEIFRCVHTGYYFAGTEDELVCRGKTLEELKEAASCLYNEKKFYENFLEQIEEEEMSDRMNFDEEELMDLEETETFGEHFFDQLNDDDTIFFY